MALIQSKVEIKPHFFGQIWDSYKSRDRGRESTMSVLFIIHYFVDNTERPNNYDTVTLKRANTNTHTNIRDMYTKEIKEQEDTG